MDWDKITLGIALVVAIVFLSGRLPAFMSPWVFGNRTDLADRARTRLVQESRTLEPKKSEPGDQAR